MKFLSTLFCLAIIVSPLLAIRAHVTDRTKEYEAIGKDVTEAVVDFILKSNIFFNDYRFLLRIAYIESQFGNDSNTFADKNGTEYNGGIWQIDQDTFIETQNVTKYPIISSKITKIEEEFGIKYLSLSWKECRKPLISGIAARLALTIIGEQLPDTLQAQSEFWFKYYNSAAESGDANDFFRKAKEMEKLNKCRGRMDLVIVMDGSGSIKDEDFEHAKEFVSKFILTFSNDNVNLGNVNDNVNLGFIVYSDNPKDIFPLNSNLSVETMNEKVLNAEHPKGYTNTGGAISRAIELFHNSVEREGTPKIILVFTDGQSNRGEPVKDAAAAAKTEGITMFAIGIGYNTSWDELLQIALNDTSHILTVLSYVELADLFDLMNVHACRITQTPGIGCLLRVEDILEQNEKRYFCYQITLEGVTVIIGINEGSLNAFYSYSIENPSSALNDGIIDGRKYIAYMGQDSNKVCVTIEGIANQNNFTIEAEKGNFEGCYCKAILGNFCGHRARDNCVLKGGCSEGDLYFCSKQYEQAKKVKNCTSECFEHYLGNDYCYPILNH